MCMSPSNNDTNQASVSARSAASKGRRTAAKTTAPAAKAAEKAGVTERVEAGRKAVIAASGQAVTFARTAWTAIARRKALVAGVGAGLTALGATSYSAGRRAGRRTLGPITRLTGGRI